MAGLTISQFNELTEKNHRMSSTSYQTSGVMAVGGALGASLGSQLPRLTLETELQKLLTDEKARAEKHKINYQQLKLEHTRLQDKLIELEAENKSTIEESRVVKDKYLAMYEACSHDLAEKIAEVEEMKTKMITPQRLELIKAQIVDELEQLYREKAKKQEGEVEEYRSALSKIRYELSFLKAEFEHDHAEHQQQMQDLIKQHNIELTNVRQDRDTTITKVQAETDQDTQKVRVLQRENAQLYLQVKELLVELEEVRAQKEKLSLDSDNVNHTQAKQISDQQATIRTIEAERESLKRQLENLQREVMASSTEHNKLRGEIHELEKKNTILKGHTEEVIHRSKVNLSDLKMEMLKQRGELEKERDRLRNEVEDLRHQVDIAESKVQQLQHMLEEKEREAVQRVQCAREEEFSKMAKVENEKFDLETRLQELERRRIDDDARRHVDQEKCNERVSQANAAKDQAERELISVKTRLSHMESLQDMLERERSENSTLKSRVHKLETELSTFNSAENELTDSNMRLKNNAELLREELKMTQSQLDRLQNNHEVILLQQRSSMAEDRAQLEMRIRELEEKLDQAQSKYSRASAIHKKLKKKTALVAERLKDKLMLLEAQNTELDLEKKALQKCVPFDQYNHLRKQWKELWRRHQEFRTILFSIPSDNTTIYCHSKVTKVQLDASALLNQSNFDNELEEQHQEDLKVLRLRLEALDKVQHQQLAELTDLTPREKRDSEKDVVKDGVNSLSDDQVSVGSNES
ncbi:unnamed protein product [Lymnaea stagnalis]|uniref:Uncharacterized protein n=1 Tax=Lymnaea stagnalis TaxID=6523 RepID=A0AAV2H0E5_LYMST